MTRLGFSGFINTGFGWSCKACLETTEAQEKRTHSRLLTEGEAESKSPTLSNRALARWADRSAKILECPGCGTREQGRIEDEDS